MSSGKIILGPVQPKFLGAYDETKAYRVLSQVIFEGLLYQCVIDAPAGTKPGASSEYWVALGASPAKIEALEQQLAEVGTDLETSNANIATLQTSVAGNSDDIDALQTDVAAAQTALDGKLDKSGGTVTGPFLTIEAVHPFLVFKQTGYAVGDAISNWINAGFLVRDKNNIDLSVYSNNLSIEEANHAAMRVRDIANVSKSADLVIIYPKNGIPFAASPPPREKSYANDIDTLRASINRHPIKLTANKNFYVGGANASDTADLFKGRGESPEMPFATLAAALNFVQTNYVSSQTDVHIICIADCSLPIQYLNFTKFGTVYLQGITGNEKLTLTGQLALLGGYLLITNFSEVDIQHTGNELTAHSTYTKSYLVLDCLFKTSESYNGKLFLAYDGGTILCKKGFEWSGKANTLFHLNRMSDLFFWDVTSFSVPLNGEVSDSIFNITQNSLATIEYPVSFTGSVTGKKYDVSVNSTICSHNRSTDLIPGTIEGTVDASSVYI